MQHKALQRCEAFFSSVRAGDIDLLVAMSYGGSRQAAGRAITTSTDCRDAIDCAGLVNTKNQCLLPARSLQGPMIDYDVASQLWACTT